MEKQRNFKSLSKDATSYSAQEIDGVLTFQSELSNVQNLINETTQELKKIKSSIIDCFEVVSLLPEKKVVVPYQNGLMNSLVKCWYDKENNIQFEVVGLA